MRPPPRVLAIDDSVLTLAAIKIALEAAGFIVDTASDLASFTELRARERHDLFVVDVQMPEAFGDDVAGALRGVYGEAAPIVLFSGLPEDELRDRAMLAGVAGHVSKKAGLGALVSKVRDLTSAAG
ncbi:MAG: response regulator [Myxococcales bacterium]|nr:response regulator [Myxococcales bacterium]